MSALNREEFFARLHERVGNDSTDEGIKFLEDMTDTYNDLEKKAADSDSENWKARYEELDNTWKKRYTHRFFSGDNRIVPACDNGGTETDDYDGDSITVESLFKKREG